MCLTPEVDLHLGHDWKVTRRLNDHVPEGVFRVVVRVILVALALKLGVDGLRGLGA